ncbi:unnamed protein product, partial [Prorocentrum cordatum]
LHVPGQGAARPRGAAAPPGRGGRAAGPAAAAHHGGRGCPGALRGRRGSLPSAPSPRGGI